MDNTQAPQTQPKDITLTFESVIVSRNDILQAISWLSLMNQNLVTKTDKEAKDNLFKIVDYMTRKG
jgi:hypothetical protein